MRWLFRLFRSVMFLAVLTATLFATTTVLAVQVKYLKASIASAAAATAIAHRKALKRASAKARLRRYISTIPIAGMAAAAYFEQRDFATWQGDNPDGTFGDYSCEVVTVSAEVMDDVLQELPEQLRPSQDMVLSALPECQQAEW